ncbi:MAG: hypothetical protein Q4F69_00835 [Bacteroidia bacterium]|nr:hypothetical protein [Bacteroidia bacterium]
MVRKLKTEKTTVYFADILFILAAKIRNFSTPQTFFLFFTLPDTRVWHHAGRLQTHVMCMPGTRDVYPVIKILPCGQPGYEQAAGTQGRVVLVRQPLSTL